MISDLSKTCLHMKPFCHLFQDLEMTVETIEDDTDNVNVLHTVDSDSKSDKENSTIGKDSDQVKSSAYELIQVEVEKDVEKPKTKSKITSKRKVKTKVKKGSNKTVVDSGDNVKELDTETADISAKDQDTIQSRTTMSEDCCKHEMEVDIDARTNTSTTVAKIRVRRNKKTFNVAQSEDIYSGIEKTANISINSATKNTKTISRSRRKQTITEKGDFDEISFGAGEDDQDLPQAAKELPTGRMAKTRYINKKDNLTLQDIIPNSRKRKASGVKSWRNPSGLNLKQPVNWLEEVIEKFDGKPVDCQVLRSRAKNRLMNPSKGKQKRVLSPKTEEDEILLQQFGIIPSKVCLKKVAKPSVTSASNSSTAKITKPESIKKLDTSKGNVSFLSETNDFGIVAEFSDSDEDCQIVEQPMTLIVLDEDSNDRTGKPETNEKTDNKSDAEYLKSFGIKDMSVNLNRQDCRKRKLVEDFDVTKVKVERNLQITPPSLESKNMPKSPRKSPRKGNSGSYTSVAINEAAVNIDTMSSDDIDKLLKQCGMAISVPLLTVTDSSKIDTAVVPSPKNPSPEPCTSKGHGKLKRKRTARKSCPDADLMQKYKLKESSVLLESLSKIEVSMLRNPHSSFGKSSWLSQKFDTDSDSDVEWNIPSPPQLEDFIEDSVQKPESGYKLSAATSHSFTDRSSDTDLMKQFGLSEPVVVLDRNMPKAAQPKRKCITVGSRTDEDLMRKFGLKDIQIVVDKGQIRTQSDSNSSQYNNKSRVHEHSSELTSDEELRRKFGISDLQVLVDNTISTQRHTFSIEDLQKGIDLAKNSISNSNDDAEDKTVAKGTSKRQSPRKRNVIASHDKVVKEMKYLKSDIKSTRKNASQAVAKASRILRYRDRTSSEKNIDVVTSEKRKQMKKKLPSRNTSLDEPSTRNDTGNSLKESSQAVDRIIPKCSNKKNLKKSRRGRNSRIRSQTAKKLKIKTSNERTGLTDDLKVPTDRATKQNSGISELQRDKKQFTGETDDDASKTTLVSKMLNLPELSISLPLLSTDEIEKYTSGSPENKVSESEDKVDESVGEAKDEVEDGLDDRKAENIQGDTDIFEGRSEYLNVEENPSSLGEHADKSFENNESTNDICKGNDTDLESSNKAFKKEKFDDEIDSEKNIIVDQFQALTYELEQNACKESFDHSKVKGTKSSSESIKANTLSISSGSLKPKSTDEEITNDKKVIEVSIVKEEDSIENTDMLLKEVESNGTVVET